MLIAEIRHKLLNLDQLDPSTTIKQIRESFSELREDLLTADVFGAMKYLPRSIGLGPFIDAIARTLPLHSPFLAAVPSLFDSLELARFSFWPQLPNPPSLTGLYTEPDVAIEFPEHVLLIEAKYRSGLGVEQLERELLAGLRAFPGKSVWVVLVTSGTSAPRIKFENERLLPVPYLQERADDGKLSEADSEALRANADHALWLSWRTIRQAIETACEESATEQPEPVRGMVADLAALLDMRMIRAFQSTSSVVERWGLSDGDLGLRLPSRRIVFSGRHQVASDQ
jgi:hypothetical protein